MFFDKFNQVVSGGNDESNTSRLDCRRSGRLFYYIGLIIGSNLTQGRFQVIHLKA